MSFVFTSSPTSHILKNVKTSTQFVWGGRGEGGAPTLNRVQHYRRRLNLFVLCDLGVCVSEPLGPAKKGIASGCLPTAKKDTCRPFARGHVDIFNYRIYDRYDKWRYTTILK